MSAFTSTFTGTEIDTLLSIVKKSAIESNTNLNNVKTPGVYTIESGTVFGTLTNRPSTALNAGSNLIVLSFMDSGVLQIIFSNYDAGFFYRVNTSGSSWSDWKFVHGESLVFKHSGSISQRPAFPANQSQFYIGWFYFDTSISPARPIFWTNDTSDGKSGWVDATGANV